MANQDTEKTVVRDIFVFIIQDFFLSAETTKPFAMSAKYLNPEKTTEEKSSRRETLGLSFTIDYLLFNKGVKGSKEEATGSRMAEQTASSMLNHQNLTPKEEGIRSDTQEKLQQRSEAEAKERSVKEEEGAEEKPEEGEDDVTTTTTTALTSNSPEKSADKPSQSYIALISKAILASEHKKLLLCDIYQWIMDHYPYFKSKVCSRKLPSSKVGTPPVALRENNANRNGLIISGGDTLGLC